MPNWKEDTWLTKLVTSGAEVTITLINQTTYRGVLIGSDLNSIVIRIGAVDVNDPGMWIPKSSILHIIGPDIDGG